jgi:hypothetical protein
MANRTPLKISDWNPSAIVLNNKANNPAATTVKKFSLMSAQQNGGLYLITPPMKTWGIQDFKDKTTGVSDGKYKLSLNFPLDATPETDMFKEKLDIFYNKIVDILSEQSPSFFGKKKGRESIADSSFPILKYPKIKESIELDYSKPPSISIKVENIYDKATKQYTKSLGVSVFDSRKNLLYPNDNPDDEAGNYVGKLSTVIASLKCNSIWVGSASWGITLSVSQIIVLQAGDSISNNPLICQIDIDDIENDEETDQKPVSSTSSSTIKKIKIPEKESIVSSTFSVPEKKETLIDDDEDDDGVIEKMEIVLPQEPVVVPPVATVTETQKVVEIDDDDDEDDDEPIQKPVVAPVPTVGKPKPTLKKIIKK